jgi:hypothetical protein
MGFSNSDECRTEQSRTGATDDGISTSGSSPACLVLTKRGTWTLFLATADYLCRPVGAIA